ncbi:acyl-CoA dehydrogenase [Sparganum proliferum]
MMRRLTDVAVRGCAAGFPHSFTGRRFSVPSSGKVSTPGQKRLPDDEDQVSPTLKKFFNKTQIAMQMPLMTRKYAVSNAALIPSFFLGQLQLELLEYPELSTKENVATVNSMFEHVEDFVSSLDSAQIDLQGRIPDPVLRSCGEIGLFGLQLDSSFNGLGLNALESTRIAEAMGLNASLFATLTAHEALGMKVIQLAGTEEQKRKYLPAMATGEKIAAFCLAEASSGSDPQPIQSRAVLSPDGRSYLLNGHKLWVANGSRADVFTVFALKTVTNDKGEQEDKVTPFIVERSFGGVHPQSPAPKLGLRGLELVDVVFSNVKVPVENVLGDGDSGLQLATRVAASDRHLVGGLCVGLLRNVIDAMVEHCQMRHRFGSPIAQFGMVQERLVRSAAHLYALESMTYLVAGMIAAQPERDLRIESSAVKLFATETAKFVLNECMALTGALGITNELPIERYLRDAYVLDLFMGPSDLLRLYIAGASLSYAGREMQKFVRMARKPLANIRYLLPKMFMKDVRLLMSAPAVGATSIEENERGARVSHRVRDHLHPNLGYHADRLSRIIYHTHEVTRQAFILHGPTVIENQLVLKLLADLAVDLLAVTACLSRASRAKSIGLRYHDHELELTSAFVLDAFSRMEKRLADYKQKGNLSKRISAVMFKENGYAAVHPLSRVW